MSHFCKTCGREHAPKCDRCGSTRDLRSFHGPCGSCAFGKAKTSAMRDELTKIAVVKKKATITKLAFIRSTIDATAHAVRNFANPVKNTVKGFSHPMNSGLLNKSLLIGGSALGLPGALKKEDPSGEGQSRGRRMGSVVGQAAGGLIGMAGSPHAPLRAGIAGSIIGDYAGKAIGGGASKVKDLLKKRQATPPPTQA